MRLFCYHLFICLIFLQVIACGGSSEKDSIAPVITLNGESAIELILDGTYVELGATAIDDIDGEIAVMISGEVVTNTIGNYTITYTATDKSGNVSNKKRLIEVIIPPTPPVITMEEDKNVIKGKFASIHAVVTDEGPLGSLQLQWSQVTNESLVLLDGTTPTLKFQVPYIADETILTFRLTATNNYGKSSTKEINITILPLFKGIKTIASDTKMSELKNSTSLQHADLDSDGDEDLYVYSELNKNIVLFVNDKASFSNSSMIDTSICKQEPLIYDFDQDGKLDFICVNNEEIYLIRNLNNANFTEPQLIYTDPIVKASAGMTFGDLNNDGKTDIAISKVGHNWVNVEVFALFNTGDDKLDNKVLVANILRFDKGHAKPYIFDANGDAYLDILLTPNLDSADFRWFENRESSNFIEHILPLKGELIGLKDWDGDSDMDLIIGDGNQVHWIESLPGNDFVTHHLGGVYNSKVTITDWDGDGDYDLFVNDLSRLYENIGNNQFKDHYFEPEEHYFPQSNTSLTSIVRHFNVVDVDFDGLDDVVSLDIKLSGDEAGVIVEKYIDTLSWKRNINDTAVSSNNIIVDSYRLRGIEELISADFDGDGDSDIISVSYVKDRLMLHKNDGLGYFNETEVILTGNINNLYQIQAVDWEGDGDIDLLFKHINRKEALNKFMLLKNNGLGVFSLPTALEFEADLGWLHWVANDKAIVKDLNKDNLQDVIFIIERPGTPAKIAIYTQTTQNKLRLLFTSEPIAGMGIVGIANIDGDDDLDIITNGYGYENFSWYEFVDSQLIEQSIINKGVSDLNIFDIDSDGDSDLVSDTGWTNSEVLINNDAVFSNMGQISLFISNKNKYLDIDFDGDIDVVGARVSTAGLPIWSEAIGPFEFLQHQSASSNKEYPTTVSDFDGDGDLDIALAHTDEQKIIFVKNQYIQKVSKKN